MRTNNTHTHPKLYFSLPPGKQRSFKHRPYPFENPVIIVSCGEMHPSLFYKIGIPSLDTNIMFKRTGISLPTTACVWVGGWEKASLLMWVLEKYIEEKIVSILYDYFVFISVISLNFRYTPLIYTSEVVSLPVHSLPCLSSRTASRIPHLRLTILLPRGNRTTYPRFWGPIQFLTLQRMKMRNDSSILLAGQESHHGLRACKL